MKIFVKHFIKFEENTEKNKVEEKFTMPLTNNGYLYGEVKNFTITP
ncbi:MAG TPA: hypothetical protein PKZ42_04140 [Syntrophales bacterium]|nr:hypothetical protein [Syntrophales bacterium]